jgi:hypothetical protein
VLKDGDLSQMHWACPLLSSDCGRGT